jgi:hypothetical protein
MKFKTVSFFLIVFCCSFNCLNAQSIFSSILNSLTSSRNLVVRTNNGLVRGQKVEVRLGRSDRFNVNEWLGIPFAEKPINDLRFKRPMPVKNWNGTLNATRLTNGCVQGMQNTNMTIISEDCLYLNIWAPDPMPLKASVFVRKQLFKKNFVCC